MKITIRGTEFELLPERAVLWIEKKILFCSDLHWGRETYLQKKGFAVPEQSFEKEAKLLKDLLHQTSARELWILGDFIHHPEGLHPDLIEQVKGWLKTIPFTKLIPGNHDRKFGEWTKELPIEVHPKGIISDNFIFLHEEDDQGLTEQNLFCWSGHLHPAIYPPLMGSEKLPCFWVRKDKAYLPAFSRMAGGMEIAKRQPSDRVFAIADRSVIEI